MPCDLLRVAVIGASGSGKTTLASRLSELLGVPHVELDALNWGPVWVERDPAAFAADVERVIAQPRWVADRNYARVRDLVWRRATTVVWLNYSFRVTFSRALQRTVGRLLRREELWAGNRESWLRTLFTRDSILWWAIKTHGRRRREFPRLLRLPEYGHLDVVELTRPQEADELVDRVGGESGGDPDSSHRIFR